MLGTRDSEIAIITQDAKTVDSTMREKPYKAGKFAFELRKRLWRDLLKIDDKVNIDDFTHFDVYKKTWYKTAKANSHIYRKVFKTLPDNILSFDQHCKIQLDPNNKIELEEKGEKHKDDYGPNFDDEEYKHRHLDHFGKSKQELKKIKGFVTLFPFNFLVNQDLSFSIADKEFMVPVDTFL